jgi:hypothetical protein
MSLNWNVKRCDESACWTKEGRMTPMCEGLIWTTMAVDMGEITKVRLDEFVWRMNFLIVHGRAVLEKDRDGTPWTEEDLLPFVGLSTNVASKTRKQWLKRVMDNMERDHNAAERARRTQEAKTA